MHVSEKWKWSRSVVSDSSWPHGQQPTRLLCPWDFPGKRTGVGCQESLLQNKWKLDNICEISFQMHCWAGKNSRESLRIQSEKEANICSCKPAVLELFWSAPKILSHHGCLWLSVPVAESWDPWGVQKMGNKKIFVSKLARDRGGKVEFPFGTWDHNPAFPWVS